MAKEVRLPQLGQTMEEGTIVSCQVKVGDQVNKGDVIFEIETDKATLEMESPADGNVKHILVEEGQTLTVGEPLMVLGNAEEQVPQSFVDSLKGGEASQAQAPAEPEQAPTQAEQPKAEPKAGKTIASPRAKKLAKDLGVNISSVTGTGPGGRITTDDVQKAATGGEKKPEATPAGKELKLGQTIAMNRLQRITAERMLKSKREIPCFYLTIKTDVTDLVKYRTKLNENSDIKVAYNDFIIRAVASGLEKFPLMTGQAQGENIRLADSIGVGLAIAVKDGLVAPILKDANKKDVRQITRDSKALIEKARTNKLAPEDLEGGCITVSNLGAMGIENFIPIVVPGQCSILGIGRITDTCVPQDGDILVRKLMQMTLSVDHKVANGAYAAQFLEFVKELMEEPESFE